MSRSLPSWVSHLGLLVTSTGLAALLAEGAARLVLNPVDYLAAHPVHDPILRVRLEPKTAGHDEWGFRNRTRLDSAEVVTMGDSQTYGVSAPSHLSWPSQLAQLTSKSVYNLSLGGYGPLQYRELLTSKALQLRPSVVVVGLYYGNDLWDAYETVYSLRYWEPLRLPELPTVSDTTGLVAEPEVILGSVRSWLARHSVLYRVATYSALGDRARGLELGTRDTASGIVPFVHPVHGAKTGFTPRARLGVLDLDDPRVREGLRLTFDRLERIQEDCRAAGVGLLVALIPTKERVHARWLLPAVDLPNHPTIRRLLEMESAVHAQLMERLEQRGIPYLDLEPALSDAAAKGPIYPSNDDGHPNSEGYGVIARAVAERIGS